MNVTELFRRLSFGELSNLTIANEGDGTIVAEKQGKVIHHANEALLALYTTFMLKKRDAVIQLQEGVSTYFLVSKYAVSAQPQDPVVTPYILDADNPFTDDLIKIVEVRDHYGRELPLNDLAQCTSVHTPEINAIQVPVIEGATEPGKLLNVRYQARHPKLEYGVLTTELQVPLALEGALTKHIAYQIYCGMNGQENAAKASEYLQMFKDACMMAEANGLVSTEGPDGNVKFDGRGFC